MKLSDWKKLTPEKQIARCQSLNPYEEWKLFKEIEAEFLNEYSSQAGIGKVFCGLGSSLGPINSITVTINRGQPKTTLPEYFLGFPVLKQYVKKSVT